MNERIPYGLRSWYPHLKPADTIIWEKFVKQNPDAYDTVIYDQAVGEGSPIPKDTEENMARDWKILTQWKIDVVGFFGDQIHIIEIKPNAGLSALGQILGYTELFKKTFPSMANVSSVIITDILRPDMENLTKIARIKIYIAN